MNFIAHSGPTFTDLRCSRLVRFPTCWAVHDYTPYVREICSTVIVTGIPCVLYTLYTTTYVLRSLISLLQSVRCYIVVDSTIYDCSYRFIYIYTRCSLFPRCSFVILIRSRVRWRFRLRSRLFRDSLYVPSLLIPLPVRCIAGVVVTRLMPTHVAVVDFGHLLRSGLTLPLRCVLPLHCLHIRDVASRSLCLAISRFSRRC